MSKQTKIKLGKEIKLKTEISQEDGRNTEVGKIWKDKNSV